MACRFARGVTHARLISCIGKNRIPLIKTIAGEGKSALVGDGWRRSKRKSDDPLPLVNGAFASHRAPVHRRPMQGGTPLGVLFAVLR